MCFVIRHLQPLRKLGLADCCVGPAHWVERRQVALQVADVALHNAHSSLRRLTANRTVCILPFPALCLKGTKYSRSLAGAVQEMPILQSAKGLCLEMR